MPQRSQQQGCDAWEDMSVGQRVTYFVKDRVLNGAFDFGGKRFADKCCEHLTNGENEPP